MKLNNEQRRAIISRLTTNCGCPGGQPQGPWSGKDFVTLNRLSDRELVIMDECHTAILNARPEANTRDRFTDGFGNLHTFNHQTNRWETVPASQVQNHSGQGANPGTPAPAQTGGSQTPPPAPGAVPGPTRNQGPAATAPAPTLPPTPPPPPARQPMNAQEWVQNAPPEIQAMMARFMEHENREKLDIIERLMEHLTDDTQRQEAYNYLSTLSMNQLRTQLLLKPQQQQSQQPQVLNYLGAAGAPTLTPPSDAEDPLVPPVIDWGQRSA